MSIKPERLRFSEAATVPIAFITAWECLFDRTQIVHGDSVLVHGVGGGVGHLVIQLARRAGARVAATVADGAEAQIAEACGAEEVIYRDEENFNLAILEWSNEAGVDHCIDTVGGRTFEYSFSALCVGGHLVTLHPPDSRTKWTVARQRNISVAFEMVLTPAYLGLEAQQERQRAILEAHTPLFDTVDLRVVTGRVFDLREAAEAHRAVESRSEQGGVVLVREA